MNKLIITTLTALTVMSLSASAWACDTCGCWAKAKETPKAQCGEKTQCDQTGASKCPVTAAELCAKCGEVKGGDKCCKEGAEKCAHCGLHKGSPGCQAKCGVAKDKAADRTAPKNK